MLRTSGILTSLAAGKLVEEGKLDLDAPIQKYVPYFPKKEHVITPGLLAGHLAGLRDYEMAAGDYANERVPADPGSGRCVLKNNLPSFEPGTRYAYAVYVLP